MQDSVKLVLLYSFLNWQNYILFFRFTMYREVPCACLIILDVYGFGILENVHTLPLTIYPLTNVKLGELHKVIRQD
jgi:hypothetical protein